MSQWQPDPRQQQQPQYLPPWQPQQGYPPQPYGQWQQPYYQRPDERRTVTYQSGSTAFHLTMTCLTGGLWGLVWLACRRKVRVTTRYR